MRPWRWLELIKDYDLEILYYSRKANVGAVALSRNRQMSVAPMLTKQQELLENLRWLDVEVVLGDVKKHLASLRLQPALLS